MVKNIILSSSRIINQIPKIVNTKLQRENQSIASLKLQKIKVNLMTTYDP